MAEWDGIIMRGPNLQRNQPIGWAATHFAGDYLFLTSKNVTDQELQLRSNGWVLQAAFPLIKVNSVPALQPPTHGLSSVSTVGEKEPKGTEL